MRPALPPSRASVVEVAADPAKCEDGDNDATDEVNDNLKNEVKNRFEDEASNVGRHGMVLSLMGFAEVGWRLSAKLDSRDDSTSLLLVFGVGDEVLLFQMFESLKFVSRRILRRKLRRSLCGLTALESHYENNDANHGTRK
jgi:hypothetical protein